MNNMKSLEVILEENLSTHDLKFVHKLLFGPQKIRKLELSSGSPDFEIKGYSFYNNEGTTEDKEKVRVGLFQNAIVEATSSPINMQKSSPLELGHAAVSKASSLGVKILCFQEIWNMPVAFCTQKKLPWVEFAENPVEGPTTLMLKELAKKHKMVIISPILERDDARDSLWNTAVVINNDGDVLGISRKNHIPISGRFSEAYYCNPSELGHPVFQTAYGRVAVSICYERHHPQSWFAYGLNGAQIVFNPSATVQSFSEHIWPIEARDAAVQNGYYTCAINRVGTEQFETEGQKVTAGPFFGSSYVTAPDGSRTPGLSIDKCGLLIVDLDLSQCSNKTVSERIGGVKIF